MSDSADPRSRSSRGRATEERLVAAARATFAAHGFAAARVEDIVAEAGVSHGTFYTYFDNKADVLDTLVRGSADRLLAVAAASWDGPDVEAALRDVIGRLLVVFADEADVIRVWLEASATEPRFERLLQQVRANFAARVATNLEPATAGSIHDPAVAAAGLVGMVEGYATERYPGASSGERQEAVATLAALWAGGMQRIASGPEE